MNKRLIKIAFIFSMTLAFSVFDFETSAIAQTIDYSKSTITITAKQMNVPLSGTFKKFTAQINFDPTKLATAKANIEINMASFDLGSDEYNQEISHKDWFDTKTYPKATFITNAIKSVSGEKFEAAGVLTIKAKNQNVTIPVIVKSNGKLRTFDGVLPIKRTTFNIGEGEWKDTSIVADDVAIAFHIVMSL